MNSDDHTDGPAPSRLSPASDPGWLDAIVEIAVEHADEGIERLLRLVRTQLGLDIAVVNRLQPGEMITVAIDGSSDAFAWSVGHAYELGGTWCKAVLEGRLPNVIPDTSVHEVRREAPREPSDPHAYVAVPVRFSSGRLWGLLCGASASAQPELGETHVKLLLVVARLIAEELERRELERHAREAGSVRAFLVSLAARDAYTGDHTAEVVDVAAAVARRLGLTERDVTLVREVALLHDIGKIALPDSILKKPGPLADWEWRLVREHPAVGAQMVAAVASTAHLAAAVRAEHERWDGSGYPDGLYGAEIPLASRIILACDAYHAMMSRRPYRAPLPEELARSELRANAGEQFDPAVVHALEDVLDSGFPVVGSHAAAGLVFGTEDPIDGPGHNRRG
ncbi:MAG: GAF and HD-GYP domain-containing protein [Thermoleophilaceae bacterium]